MLGFKKMVTAKIFSSSLKKIALCNQWITVAVSIFYIHPILKESNRIRITQVKIHLRCLKISSEVYTNQFLVEANAGWFSLVYFG